MALDYSNEKAKEGEKWREEVMWFNKSKVQETWTLEHINEEKEKCLYILNHRSTYTEE